jgi:4-amino-4-deoxy-L-arabinose transferase-like glycosyltransferase
MRLGGLIALAAAITLGTAGWGDLYNETDGQYAGAAKAMAISGSWLIPENAGIPRLAKPPLLYWMMAVSMKIFGINEFAARLPNALAVTGWVAVTFLIGSQIGGRSRGFLAGVILLTSLGTFTLGRIIMPEPLFSAFIAGALYCVLRGLDQALDRRKWYLGFWIFASLASFAKGWHGVLYPLTIVGLAAVLCRTAREGLRGLLSWQGVLLFAMINLPWHIYVELQFPGYIHNLLISEQVGHIIGASTPATSYTNVPRWQFLLLQLAWLFPWSLGLVTGIPLFVNQIRRSGLGTLSFPAAIVIAWLVVILGSVLLLGQRQDYYAMSLWPAIALALTSVLKGRRLQIFLILVSVFLSAALLFSATPSSFIASPYTAALEERVTAWTTIANLDKTVWASLQTTAALALGGALFFAVAGLLFQHSKFKLSAATALAICLDLGAVSGTSLVSPYFSLAKIAGDIDKGSPVVYDGAVDTGSSLLFYSDSPVMLLNQNPQNDFVVRQFGIGRDRFLMISEFVAFWNSKAPAVLITEESKLALWRELLGASIAPAARCGTQILLKNTN